jgi:hypothetical protein
MAANDPMIGTEVCGKKGQPDTTLRQCSVESTSRRASLRPSEGGAETRRTAARYFSHLDRGRGESYDVGH